MRSHRAASRTTSPMPPTSTISSVSSTSGMLGSCLRAMALSARICSTDQAIAWARSSSARPPTAVIAASADRTSRGSAARVSK
jgi:hypothetical protein